MALGSKTATGYSILAKNSDRHPNEPQYYVHVPAKDHPAGSKVKCTYIEIEQVPHTYSIILSKPSWIWGGEMGTNEFGVTIGNEALWTHEPYNEQEDALLGMDMLRLALERAKTADEALDLLIDLLERYGQGGNCGFDGECFYHNEFLIADANSGWVLETAGKYWAVEKVKGIRTISNTMSVHKYERIHPEAIKHAIDMGYCQSEKDFDFTEAFLDKEHPFTYSGENRRCKTNEVLNAAVNIDMRVMRSALTAHSVDHYWEESFDNSPCMHAAGPQGDCQSTASLIAVIRPDGKTTYWGTNMSTPCIAVFKPFWFDAYADDVVFDYDKQEEAMDMWLNNEKINRAFIDGRIDENKYRKELESIQENWFKRCTEIEIENASKRKAFSEEVSKEARDFVNKWIDIAENALSAPKGDEVYQEFWTACNKKLGKNRYIAY